MKTVWVRCLLAVCLLGLCSVAQADSLVGNDVDTDASNQSVARRRGAAGDVSGRNSHFWMTLKPRAGTRSATDTDLVLANGYRRVNLGSSDLSCTRVNNGSSWVYQITWTGNSYLGGPGAETLQFNVVVEAFSAADYTYAVNNASVTSLGHSSMPTDMNNRWGVGADVDLDPGESIRMAMENVTVDGARLAANGLVLEDFESNILVRETAGGSGHKMILGEGTNLPSASFDDATATIAINGESFSVTGADSATPDTHFAVESLRLNFIVRNPALTVEDPDNAFSDLPDGHTYGPTPYEPTTPEKLANAFPKFSWDRLPRTMLIRHSSAGYTDEQIKRMAKAYDIIVLEKTHGGFAGYRKTAARLKAVNPDIKVVFYWNHELWFGDYGIDPITPEQFDEFIDNRPKVRGRVHQYDRQNPNFIEWWTGTVFKMLGLEEGFAENGDPFIPSNIDGTFIDRRDYPSYMYIPLYEGMPDDKFHMCNNGNEAQYRSRIQFLDGTYREGAYHNLPFSIALQRETARNKKLTMVRGGPGGSDPRDMEDGIDHKLAVYLSYAEPYSYFYCQSSVDATSPQWKWLTDYYDQGLRPLGAPFGEAITDGWIITRSFEHCDLFYDMKTDSGGRLCRILWKNDVGSPALAGSGRSSSDYTYTLKGSGNISGTGDNFFFLSDLHYGNGELVAKLDSLDNTHVNARAGVMFRERNEPVAPGVDYSDVNYVDDYVAAYSNGTILASGARTVAVLRDPSGQMHMVYRSMTGGNLLSAGVATSAQGPYAKLARSWDSFVGFCSPDGETWTEIGRVTLLMAEKVEAGMVVCSGDDAALAEATFSAFSRVESTPVADSMTLNADKKHNFATRSMGLDDIMLTGTVGSPTGRAQ